MVCCALFGHHDSPDSIRPMLKQEICSVLEVEPDCCFLVGNQGRFDALALSVFKELEQRGERIDYSVVLAYLPEDKSKLPAASEHTLYPEGIETVPKRFAISWRNKWMVSQSDMVVCYIRHWTGGAGKFVELAQKKGNQIINIAK